MGFPVAYSALPGLLLHALLLLSHLRRLLSCLSTSLGLGDLLLDSDASFLDPPTPTTYQEPHPLLIIDNILPVVSYSSLRRFPPESCAVCLYELEGPAEVRQLTNCSHAFHRRCLDRWIEHGPRTCPLCRAPLFPGEAGYFFFHDDESFTDPFPASAVPAQLVSV